MCNLFFLVFRTCFCCLILSHAFFSLFFWCCFEREIGNVRTLSWENKTGSAPSSRQFTSIAPSLVTDLWRWAYFPLQPCWSPSSTSTSLVLRVTQRTTCVPKTPSLASWEEEDAATCTKGSLRGNTMQQPKPSPFITSRTQAKQPLSLTPAPPKKKKHCHFTWKNEEIGGVAAGCILLV